MQLKTFFKQTQTPKILALYANRANRNTWFQANSRQGTIGSKQTQTAKALSQAMPTETFGFKQTQHRVPLDLSNPDNKKPFHKTCQRKHLVPSKIRQDTIRYKQTQTAENLGSTQTMPTETFNSKQTQTGSVRSKQTQTAETLGSTETHANRNIWFQTNSEGVPLDLSKPRLLKLLALRKPYHQKHFASSKLRHGTKGSNQTKTRDTIGLGKPKK